MKHFFVTRSQTAGIFVLLFLFLSAGCVSESGPRRKNGPQVKPLSIFRADMLLHENKDSSGLTLLDSLRNWDPVFAEVYTEQILRTPDNAKASPQSVLAAFQTEAGIPELLDTVMRVLPDLDTEEKEFAEALSRFETLFPGKAVPKIVACVTALSLAAFTVGDSVLAFSSDFFLGPAFAAYEAQYPRYVTRTFTRPHILPKSITALVQNYAGPAPDGGTLLDQMLYHGKVLAAVKRLLPETADSLILEYTGAQAEWVRENELPIWGYLTKADLLYKTELSAINKLVNPSPNSPGMPPEAPGRTANFIGWRIVEAYLKKNPQITFEQLLGDRDSQALLQKSAYKPAR